MNKIQSKAMELIKNDLRLIYTIFVNTNIVSPSYCVAFMPYMGMIIDGTEDWIRSYNNSNKDKLEIPLFTKEEQQYYEAMRNSVKMFENDLDVVYEMFQEKYLKSDAYFSSLCKPIAKTLHLYDIFGVFKINGEYCDNTILDSCYAPFYEYNKDNYEFYKQMAVITGKYLSCFNVEEVYPIKTDYVFSISDYGGFVKSPVGNEFSYRFLLFTIYCQINFIIKCINDFIESEISTKLRLSYILYYYLLKILPDINTKYNCDFKISDKYNSDIFRNAMAHYKLGVLLKEDEIIETDIMFGLTQKCFGTKYITVKDFIIEELKKLSNDIKDYLKI